MRISDWSSDVCSSDLAWLQSVPKIGAAALAPQPPATQQPDQLADHAGNQQSLPAAAATAAPAQRRVPIGAGVEPPVRKYGHYQSGEKDHWDGEPSNSNQGDDRK